MSLNHTLEPASTGRAKCRACDTLIPKGELRFGERRPNPFGEGEMTLWFHPICAAYKRPAPLIEYLDEVTDGVADRDALLDTAKKSAQFRRLPRVSGAQRAPTGRARCRHCKSLIEKEAWRVPLVYFEEGRFSPMGFIHAGCASEYLDTADILDRVQHFTPELDSAALESLSEALNP